MTDIEVQTAEEKAVAADGTPQPEQEKKFTQADLDRIVKERLKRAERNMDTAQQSDLATQKAELDKKESRIDCHQFLLDRGYPLELLDILDTSNLTEFKSRAAKIQSLIRSQPPLIVPPLAHLDESMSFDPKGISDAFSRGNKHKPKSFPPEYPDY